MYLGRQTIWAVATARLVLLQGAIAQDLDETIVGCADVQCPTKSGSTSAECKLVDKTFTAVGLARIPVKEDSLEGLSWVEGVAVTNSGDKNRTFDKSFYLGTPAQLNLNGTGSCALFFSQVSERVYFGKEGEDQSTAQGTCDQAMSEKCVSALIARAEDLEYEGLSSKEACEKLEKDFQDNLDSECASAAPGSKWVGLRSSPLSEDEDLGPIESPENSTSNCWPVVPKSHNLLLVESFSSEGDNLATTLSDKFYGVTPILTVFFPGTSDDIVSKPLAQMTCMKTLGATVADEATKSGDDADKKNGSGSLTSRTGMAALLACILSAFVLV